MSRLTVKGVKNFMGHDCPGYNCTLYLDGEKVATVVYDGGGGDTQYGFYFLTDAADRRALEKKVMDFARTLPDPDWFKESDVKDEDGRVRLDCLVEDLVAEDDWRRKVARACKKKTAFVLPTDEKDSFRVLSLPWGDLAKAWLAKKYPGVKVRVLNEEQRP